ncbi:MAG: tail fiber domain-containing protein [Chloroflexota bacterium]
MTSETLNNIERQRISKSTVLVSVLIGILVLSVFSLFYKVNVLEKTLEATSYKVNTLEGTLEATIDELSYVKALAVNADQYAHSHEIYSDSRLKVNISPIKDPLQAILSLNGVTFFWNTSDYPELGLSNEPQIGFIAQELEQVYPELVHVHENGYKTIDYVSLIPVLTEAIKQQQLMIVELQKEIIELRKNAD